MAGASGSILPVETTEQTQARVSTALAPLTGVLGNIERFSVEAIINSNLTVDIFLKAIKSLVAYAQQDILENIASAANTAGAIQHVINMTPKDLFDLSRWVKTAAGMEAISKITTQRRLLRQGGAGRSASQVAWVNLFTQQQADYAQEKKRKMTRFERKREDLKLQLAQLDTDEAASMERLAAKYPTQVALPATMETELVAACWAAYVADCDRRGITPSAKTNASLTEAVKHYSANVRDQILTTYCEQENVQADLTRYAREKIQSFRDSGNQEESPVLEISIRQQLEQRLISLPLELRKFHMKQVPFGIPLHKRGRPSCKPLLTKLSPELLLRRTQIGHREKPPLGIRTELAQPPLKALEDCSRIGVLRSLAPQADKLIPRSRSKWEAGVRKIIGGGELKDWFKAKSMYRGGGNLFDALRLLSACDDYDGYTRLKGNYSVEAAREKLLLPSGLRVPDGVGCVHMKNFNDEASAGPLCRAFGIRRKAGLKSRLEQFAWEIYDGIGNGDLDLGAIPPFLARVGYRTKLVTGEKAMRKISTGDSIGRAIMMLDAYEQAFSSPIFNVISDAVTHLHSDPTSGWRNYLIRASSDWGKMYKEMRKAKVVVELDWKKFDRERPADHISFFIDVILSCFAPRTTREEKLLGAYRRAMENALLHRVLMTDDGGVLTVDGMVPSGSLWTGIIGTGLNILYIGYALSDIGISPLNYVPKCAGDDNLTFFSRDYGDAAFKRLRVKLNEMFRANIDEEDFIIHRTPFFVTKAQAVFPPGTDLSKGTSSILNQCKWVQFEGEIIIDEAMGLSHRWEYRFQGKPKFLANYWLPDGRSIRPATDSLERLLYPEGLHQTIEDYEMAVLAMVVDNPWNSHNVNHMMHRFCIVQQIKRQSMVGIKAEDVMWYSKLRGKEGEGIPYPQVAYWRRQEKKVFMEEIPELMGYIKKFQTFLSGVSTLYSRDSAGGIDAWMFMSILRGERDVGAGQFGNDIIEWCKFLNKNPLTSGLRAAKRFRGEVRSEEASTQVAQRWVEMISTVRERLRNPLLGSPRSFALWVSDMYAENVFSNVS
uniref:Fusion protein n=1 Tax=Blueberry latent virus TaxID=430710 RepID=A0A3G9K3E3_9VIRU|nr:fusion protein [Blueberry latent virus]BBI01012.1 fusion protein [Blueberry latent virus]